MSEIEIKAPERIRVAQDEDGFWTCREARISDIVERLAASLGNEYTYDPDKDEAIAEIERLRLEVSAQAADINRLRGVLERLVSHAERFSLDKGFIAGRLYDAARAALALSEPSKAEALNRMGGDKA